MSTKNRNGCKLYDLQPFFGELTQSCPGGRIRTATLDRERNEACGVERRNSSLKRRKKNIRHPPRRVTLIKGKATSTK